MMAVLFGLLTALSNAIAVTTQHIASTSDVAKSKGWRFVLYLVQHPLWLLGLLAMTGSLVFQAIALHFGPLSLVQPLLVSELVLAIVLRRLWLHQSIRPITWIAALLTGTGLVIFLVETSPKGRLLVPSTSSWVAPAVACVGAVLALVALAQRGSPSRRAGLFASATAVLWALEATFIKATSDDISSFGFAGALARWPLYALVVGGLLGLVCEQAALHVGPLSVSQPYIVIVDPIVSIALGVWLYHEHLHSGLVHLSVAALAFVAMCVGVVMLTRTAPATMKADVHRL